ncbi:putative Major facilitator family transporter [Candidatus Zixiibacteriota bacterium]|nr:putative Major facilitator family transporter [candidate division Zixibacteria bacterium]
MFDSLKKFDKHLWILMIGWFTSSVGFSISIPFISIYFHSELKMSLSQIGVFFGVAAIVRAVSQSVGGELSDRIGRFRIMIAAQVLRSITFIFVAYSIYAHMSFWSIGGLIIINFIFGSFFQPAANAAVADLVPMERRTEGYAVVRSAENLGWASGPAIGGFVASASYSTLFILSSILVFVSAVIITLSLRGIPSLGQSREKSDWRYLFVIRGNEKIFLHAGLVLLLYLSISQMIAPFSLYSVDFIGITKAQLGFLFTLNGLMVTFLQLPTTRLLHRVRLTNQLALGSIIYACGFFLIGLTHVYAFYVTAFVLITMAENCVSPPALSIAANLAPEGRIGRYMGIYGFAVTGGWSLGPLLGGLLLDWAKPNFMYMWGIISLMVLLAAVGFRRMAGIIPAELNLYRK